MQHGLFQKDPQAENVQQSLVLFQTLSGVYHRKVLISMLQYLHSHNIHPHLMFLLNIQTLKTIHTEH